MNIHMTKWFARWSRKQGLTIQALCAAVDEMARGLVDADLGGGLFKKRIARPGEGKSGGWRTLVVSNMGDRWFFVFGFPKNERGNITPQEEEALKAIANRLLNLNAQTLLAAVSASELIEVNCHATT